MSKPVNVPVARQILLEALQALNHPTQWCRDHDFDPKDSCEARSYVAASAKVSIEHALHSLGEPINPFRRDGSLYEPANPPLMLGIPLYPERLKGRCVVDVISAATGQALATTLPHTGYGFAREYGQRLLELMEEQA